MPGASVTLDYGKDGATVTAVTYATRLAWFPIGPKWSAVWSRTLKCPPT